ncbi:MAG: MFS transporter, partial [Planctomycetota bacterium]|jgi:acyl-[acyl-carrier-protein]-phospholipid O-acyltransferase/long-chain-fatty-acid--[acyl-carrier-protein] ligase
MELFTFTAIILGSVAGGGILDLITGMELQLWYAGALLTLLAVIGFFAIRTLPPVPAANASCGLGETLRGAWKGMRSSRILWLSVLGSVIFWGLASLFTQNIIVYGKSVLALTDTDASIPLGITVIGIGIGCYLAGRLSRRGVETGWIPVGGIGLTLAAGLMGLWSPDYAGTLALMILLGISSGFVVVPINTLMQVHAPADRRGSVVALANGMAFGGVLLGTLACGWMAGMGMSAAEIFLGAAGLTAVATLWGLTRIIITRAIYRIRLRGLRHIPDEGGALLIPNHLSFIDVFLLQAACARRIRFLADEEYYQRPLMGWIMRVCGTVPISRHAGPRDLLNSMRKAGELLDQGELVCIFAEGEISRTGQMLPFQRGYQKILKGREVPVIPVSLDRVWGSIFSFAKNKALGTRLRSWPIRVGVSFGEPMPASVEPTELRDALRSLSADSWIAREGERQGLHRSYVRSARRRPLRLALADAQNPKVSRIKLLSAGVAMARALRREWKGRELVGLLLPPCLAGAATNLAASLSGRAVANLNYSMGAADILALAKQAKLDRIVTSRAFVEQLGFEFGDELPITYLEDLQGRIGSASRLWALLLSIFAPLRFLEKACGASKKILGTDPATVIFSSGSTGQPKGVVLSHANLAANAEGVGQALPVTDRDRLLASLPLFHAFGTFSLWFCLRQEIALICQPNPLDAKSVGEMVERYRASMLVATPSFLQLYMRRVHPGQFGSLEFVIVGGERLPPRVSEAFENHFGIKPLEGYGCTECSPVIALSSPCFRAPGVYQMGSKSGSVGRPMPGVAVRIVDVDSGEDRPSGEEGLILVRGPNLMQRYLDREDLTAEVLVDGWYRTGDIGFVDEDGFLFITDRLSRFAKIAGEMVPLGRVEDALQEAGGMSELAFAVTAVEADGRGEKLKVLHTCDSDLLPDLLERLRASALPKLFLPKQEDFHRVESLPLLGTGKLDLRALKELAASLD